MSAKSIDEARNSLFFVLGSLYSSSVCYDNDHSIFFVGV